MDFIIAFKKYLKNIKLISTISILFLFTLFLINPLFNLSGGTLNLSYILLNQDPGVIALTFIGFIAFIVSFTLFQTIIIFKIEKEYDFENYAPELRSVFFELLKFNIVFYLSLYILSAVLYNSNLLANVITNTILLIFSILFWFIPQIVVMEKESAAIAVIINFNYLKRNWIHLIHLFVTGFVLTLITFIIDASFGYFGGSVLSTLFFVLFVIPYIEILKTEVYLDKYNLLKPIY